MRFLDRFPDQARRVGVNHRKERERRRDGLHQISHRLTAKARVAKVEALNARGIARNKLLALSVADAGMVRLGSLVACKADWRGRQIVAGDPWCPSSQTCSMRGALHREMRHLKVQTLRCDCGHRMVRDHNAAANIHWYPEERENRGGNVPTRMETGNPELAPVPVSEVRISACDKQ